jgi:multidrug efflux pump subunit AcrA (membrane-fusion protein)
LHFQTQIAARLALPLTAVVASFLFSACERRDDPVSGTIEVDEVHVAPRFGGRVAKIRVREGDMLSTGDVIVELEAPELSARREVAAAAIHTAERDVEAIAAQLKFMRADAKRQQDLLRSSAVSSNEASARRASPPRRRKASPPPRPASSRRAHSSRTWRRS